MPARTENRFISSLSQPGKDLLLAQATHVPLPLKTFLYRAGEPAQFVFFLTSGIASVVTSMVDGGSAEVGMIGNEGLIGSPHVLGPALPLTDCMIQLSGTALRIPLRAFSEIARSSEEVRSRLLEFIQHQTIILGQVAACNRLHSAEERLSRWLLMAFDRNPETTLDFTQEFIADMVGTRRTTVTAVAGTLQRAGLINYERGRVRILNRAQLASTACTCYPILERLTADLYQGQIHQVLAHANTYTGLPSKR